MVVIVITWRICFSAWQLLKRDMEEPETRGSMDAQGEIKERQEEMAIMQEALDMAEDVAVMTVEAERHRALVQAWRAACPWSQAKYSTIRCP